MQLFTSLGKPWDLSVRPLCKALMGKFPVELFTLFSFVFVAQQFIEERAYSVAIHVLWTILVYLLYLTRSYCNSNRFNRDLGLDIDEIVELFQQLPNGVLMQDLLFGDQQSSTNWLNGLLASFWPKFSVYFGKKFKGITFTLAAFCTLENFSIGQTPPLVESLTSSLVSHNHEHTLTLKFTLYWFANSAGTAKQGDQQALTSLKCLHYSIGSLISFCFKATCQMQFAFRQWQLNEQPQLSDVHCSFTETPSLQHLHTTGLLWLLDRLQLVRPIVCAYLQQRFRHPKRAVFKFIGTPTDDQQTRRPSIGCPMALFCVDVIQAENLPLAKARRARPQADLGEPEANRFGSGGTPRRIEKLQAVGRSAKRRAKRLARQSISPSKQNEQTARITDPPKTSDSPPGRRCKLFKCSSYRLPSAYCRVKIFNHQFTCQPAASSTNPLWNFRSFVPIFSHNRHSVEQMQRYHSLFSERLEANPIDLNASYYRRPSPGEEQKDKRDDGKQANVRQFISYELLENLSLTIQLFDKQADHDRLIGEFQIADPSQYFLDPETNGQSIWLSSASAGVQAKDLDQSIKINVRFSFFTLNQMLNPTLLHNAYLANRLAFPIGTLLIFIDSAIGLNVDTLKCNLNPQIEYGFQIVCQLGNQTLYTSICSDLSFIWENELLFCVYSLSLEKLTIKLVARSLNASNYDQITITTSELDLASLVHQQTPSREHFCPLYVKGDPPAHLKMLLTFRVLHFTGKLASNCLRNAKVAEEDALVREKHHVEEKLEIASPGAKQSLGEQEETTIGASATGLINKLHMKADEELDENDSTEELDQGDLAEPKAPEAINIVVNVRMRWPKAGRFVIEIVDLRCGQFLTLFQLYSIHVYLVFVLREKEKALQSKRTKSFQLNSSMVAVNQELQFNCISKPLSAYHLNVSLHEKRTEEYSKVAEVYSTLPPLILASGQIDKQIVLDLMPMYLKTSGLNEPPVSHDYELDQFEMSTIKPRENEPATTSQKTK